MNDDPSNPTAREFAAIAAALATGFVVLYWLSRGFWFYVDDWNFLLLRDGGSIDGLLRPHVNHWQTTQVAWYRLVYNVWGLETYRPLLAAAIAMHVAASGAIWWALRRLGVRAWLAFGAAALLLGFGNGGSDFAHGLFFGSGLGRFGYGLAIGLLAASTSRRQRIAVAAILLISVMSSGLSVNVTIAVLVSAVIARRIRELWWVPVPALIAVAAWYSSYGLDAVRTTAGSSGGNIIEGLRQAALVTPWKFTTSLLGLGQIVGIAVAFLLIASFISRVVRWSISMSEWIGIVAAGGFLLQLGIVRFAAGGGFQPGPGTPRYMYVLAFLLMPFIAATLERLLRHSSHRWVGALVAALITVAVLSNAMSMVAAIDNHTDRSREIRTSVASAAAMVRTDSPFVAWGRTHPRWSDPLSLRRLKSEIASGWSIGTRSSWAIPELVEELAQESRLVYGRHYPWQKASVGVEGAESPDGCVAVEGTLSLNLVKDGDGWLRGPVGASVSIALIDQTFTDTDTFVLSRPEMRIGYMLAEQPQSPGTLEITTEASDLYYCGVASSSS